MKKNILKIALSFAFALIVVGVLAIWISLSTDSFYVQVKAADGKAADFSDCSFDFLQIKEDPKPEYFGKGVYHFKDLGDDELHLSVNCPGYQESMVSLNVYDSTVFVSLLSKVPEKTLCVAKAGLPIDLDTPSVDMSRWLGRGNEDGSCNTKALTYGEKADIKVLDISGHGCHGLGDPHCMVRQTRSKGRANFEHLVYGVTPSQIDSRIVEETSERFTVTLGLQGQKVDVHLIVLNGRFNNG